MIIWATAVLVYLAAVFHRTSLGVASLEASQRFGLGPAALGTFTVLQIGVYALMQVPTGMLVDRYGARRVLTIAAVLMGLGQLLFAFATSYPLGLLARAVLGVGDEPQHWGRWATCCRPCRCRCCSTASAGRPRSPSRAP